VGAGVGVGVFVKVGVNVTTGELVSIAGSVLV
jgi:hypothetical protein